MVASVTVIRLCGHQEEIGVSVPNRHNGEQIDGQIAEAREQYCSACRKAFAAHNPYCGGVIEGSQWPSCSNCGAAL